MNPTRALMVLAAILIAGAPAQADWDPGDPDKMHHPQLPDLDNGMDVLNGPAVNIMMPDLYFQRVLADDWRCSATGAVTGIHIWASYNEDFHPDPPPNLAFNLAVYSNIPAADSPNGYSIPGDRLWHRYVRPTAERNYATADEAFYDPTQQEPIGWDKTCWQYNFSFDASDAFVQTKGEIYWLAVAYTTDLNATGYVDLADFMWVLDHQPWLFGWKTSADHFEDDAVWIDQPVLNGPPDVMPGATAGWNNLLDPSGNGLDLAFVIVPEPVSASILGLGAVATLRRRRKRRT